MTSPLWPAIVKRAPAAWIWMGDNVYADTKRATLRESLSELYNTVSGKPSTPLGADSTVFVMADAERISEQYRRQLESPLYQKLMRTSKVLGTWDDHDYGINDGDQRYPHRDASQQLILDFLQEPPDAARRKQRGIYTAHTFTIPADDSEASRSAGVVRGSAPPPAARLLTVTVILLDVRYHKTPYCTWPARLACHGREYDFLGAEQWEWLNTTLRESTSDVNLVVSGVQILAEHRWQGENWARFPSARARLLSLILNSGARGVLLASGDVHFAEISRAVCKPVHARGKAAEGSREMWEVTSSGMTHSWGTLSLPARLAFRLTHAIFPYRYQHFLYTGLNVAQLDFYWNSPPGEQQGASDSSSGGGGGGTAGAGSSGRQAGEDDGDVVIRIIGAGAGDGGRGAGASFLRGRRSQGGPGVDAGAGAVVSEVGDLRLPLRLLSQRRDPGTQAGMGDVDWLCLPPSGPVAAYQVCVGVYESVGRAL